MGKGSGGKPAPQRNLTSFRQKEYLNGLLYES
jgi:hypothetical protein